jgi:transposase
MPNVELFQRALGLEPPWEVVEDEFDAGHKRLDLRVDFARGSRFPCLECGRDGCRVHDTETQMWRHLNFWQHEGYLTARVPRVECPEHGVRWVKVPWARPRSDFTLLFEALLMAMVKEMPVAAIAKLVGEYDKKIWRVVQHYVDAAVAAQDLSAMEELGIDDTSFRRGQSYVSVFADLDPAERRAVFVADGRDHETVEQFGGFLGSHGGRAERIREVSQDMSGPYLSGVREHLEQAQVTFDRFHVKQKLSEAIDTVRRAEAKEEKGLLRNTRYLWLKRPEAPHRQAA